VMSVVCGNGVRVVVVVVVRGGFEWVLEMEKGLRWRVLVLGLG